VITIFSVESGRVGLALKVSTDYGLVYQEKLVTE